MECQAALGVSSYLSSTGQRHDFKEEGFTESQFQGLSVYRGGGREWLSPHEQECDAAGHTTKTGRKRSRILYSQESVTSTLLPLRVTTTPNSLLAGDQVFKPLSLQGHSTSSTELGSTPL